MRIYKKEPTLRRNIYGFSLIELMVTLSIAAVLLSVAVPSMSSLVRDARLSTQADLLVRTINGTRMEAIKQRKNFKICPTATPDTATACSTVASDWFKGWLVIDSDNTISQRISGKSGITVTSAAVALEFTGTLGTPTAASSFTICAPTRMQIMVNVSASGHVYKRIDTTVCS